MAWQVLGEIVATDDTGTLAIYDREGRERFRSSCSSVRDSGVSWDSSDRDIDPSICCVFDRDGKELAWFRDPGLLASGETIVLTLCFEC
jgi:hypothetical protein